MSAIALKLVDELDPVCRRCGSKDVRKSDVRLRVAREELVQTYFCRACSTTFTAGPVVRGRIRRPRLEDQGADWGTTQPRRQILLREFAPDFRVHFTEEARARMQSDLAARGHYEGPLYKRLRKTTHRGRDPGVWPGSMKIGSLRLLAEQTGEPLEYVESHVVRIFKLSADKSLSGPFPREVDGDWAWLMGLFFSCGTVSERDNDRRNEHQVHYKVDVTVLPELLEVAAKAGLRYATESGYISRQNKTFEKVRVLLPSPAYDAMARLGLPHVVRSTPIFKGGGRRRASRDVNLRVPDFVRHGDAEIRRRFVEGYMNGTKFQAWNWRRLEHRGKHAFRVHSAGADVRFLATSEGQAKDFADFTVRVLNDNGVVGTLRRMHTERKNVCYGYHVSNPFSVDALLTKFRLFRETTRRSLGTPEARR